MGNHTSKEQLQALQRQQELLMKQNADMAKRLADEQENHKKQHEEHLAQMAQMMLVLMAGVQTKQTKREKQLIEIEDVTYDVTEELDRGCL